MTEVGARVATSLVCMLLQIMERQAAHRQYKFRSQWLRSLQVRASCTHRRVGVARSATEISHLLLWVTTETLELSRTHSSKNTLIRTVGGVIGSCKNNLLVLKQPTTLRMKVVSPFSINYLITALGMQLCHQTGTSQ